MALLGSHGLDLLKRTPVYQSTSLPVYQSTSLPVYQSTSLPVYQSTAFLWGVEGHGKRFGKGVIRRLAVLLGSAALLLPLAGPVGQQTGAVARYLLTMAAMTMATPAQAQAVTTLVTNGSEPVSSSLSRAFQAQAFTTGDHATGYIVTAVQIGLGIAGERSISAVIREDNGGEPGELVATLTNPISFTNYTLHTFTAPVGTALDPNTTYWLSIHEGVSDSGGGIPLQKTNNPGETGLTGWSIADNHLRRFNEMTSNNPMMPVYQHQTVWGTVTGEALRISIRGYAVDVTAPSFDSATVNDDSLTITFDEALDTTKTPATAAFDVQVDGSTVTVSTVAVSDSTVTLTLATAVTTGQSVTVAYTKPDSGDVVQDESGNELATFTTQTATNVTRPTNTPATGAPTISGTARVGEELTASTSEIMDDNGITGATFAYQWVRDDGTDEEDINGATLSTYRVTSNDGGATLKVKVSFTDDDGFDEEVISDPTATIDVTDTTAPVVEYTVPTPLAVGTQVAMSPLTEDDDIASYSATGLPAWLTINATTGLLTGSIPDTGSPSFTTVVTVTDTSGNSAEVTLIFPLVEGPAVVPDTTPPPVEDPAVVPDTTPPTVVSATLVPSFERVTLTLSEATTFRDPASNQLRLASDNLKAAFTVTEDDVEKDITYILSGNGKDILIYLAQPAVSSSADTVVLSYDQSAAGNDALQDSAGNRLASFMWAIRGSIGDTPAPTLTSIERQTPATSPTNADSLTWRVTFSEAVENVDTADFTVGGSTATVTNVQAVSGETGVYDVTASGGDLAGYTGTVTLGFASNQNIADGADNALVSPTLTGTSNSYMVDNTPPMVTYTSPDSLVVGTAVTAIEPSTADTDIASYSATGLPAGLVIDPTTGVISGSPVTASADPSMVMVTVTDTSGNSTTVRLTFLVGASAQPGVRVTPIDPSLNEGSTTSYTVTLNTQPAGPVTITPTTGDSGAVSVSPVSLTFTPSNWDTPQTVMVAGVNDDDNTNETVTISHSVSGYGLVTTAAAVTVSVTDTDEHDATQDDAEQDNAEQDDAEQDDAEQDDAETSEAAKEADAVLEEVVLPDVVQQLTAQTTETITSRLNSIASGGTLGAPLTLSLANVVADTVAFFHGEREHLKNGSLEWRQAVSGRHFAFPLSALTLAQGEGAGGQEGPLSSLTVWGGGDYSSYGNIIDGTDVDGNGFSGTIGMDMQPIPRMVTGLVLTTNRWGLDYATDASDSSEEEGTYGVNVTMVNPYVNWLATDQLNFWATFGYGRGEVEQKPDGAAADTQTDGLTSWAGGLRFELLPGVDPLTGEGSPLGLAFKVDGGTSSFLDTQVQLARLAAEVSRFFAVENGLLSAALELGWNIRSVSDKDEVDGQRQRIADKDDGGGAELAGSLNWLNTDGSVSATVDTRVLFSGGDHREWGIGGHLRFAPSRTDGEGLSLTLQPSFGVTGTQLDELWSLSGDGDPAMGNDLPSGRLDAQLAYGFRHGNGLLTPYTEVVLEDATSIYGAGLRYGLPLSSLELDLKGVRGSNAEGNPEHRLLLQLRSDL